MTFLLLDRPNWIIPVFRQTGSVLEYKRFPADYMWRSFLDLSGLEFDDAAILASIAALEANDAALSSTISGVAIIATDASDAAAAAQSTANAALAAAGVADKTIERFADSAVITGATPSISTGTQYRYNYVRFTTVLNAIWKWYFVADLSLGASITVLYEQASGQATVDLKINGSTVASKDFSAGGTVNNQSWTVTLSAGVHGAGRHTLELVSGGGGSVGAGFAISLHKVWINAN